MDMTDPNDHFENIEVKSKNVEMDKIYAMNKSNCALTDTMEMSSKKMNQNPEFKLNLPDKLASFQAFVEMAMPVLKQIEEYIAANFSLTSQKKSAAKYEEESSNNEPQVTLKNRNLFCVYGALLKEILVPEIMNDGILFKMNRAENEALDMEEIFGVSKLNKLEESRLLLNIQRNNQLDAATELDEEMLWSLLSNILQRVQQGDNKVTLIEDVSKSLKTKVTQMVQDEKSSRIHEPMKHAIGGSFNIFKLNEENFNKMDIENEGMQESEIEFNRRLLLEYNNPAEFCKKLPLGFTENLIQNKSMSDVSFYTVLLLQIVFSRRLAKAEKALTEQKAIEDLLETSKFIPLPGLSHIKRLRTKLMVTKALDVLLEPEVEKLLRQAECRTPTQKAGLEKLCSELTGCYYDQNCLISTPFFKKLGAYKNNIELFVNTGSNSSQEAKMSENGTSVSKSEKLESFKGENEEEEGDDELERMMLEDDEEDLVKNSPRKSVIKGQSHMVQESTEQFEKKPNKDMTEENQGSHTSDMEEEQLEGKFSSEGSPMKEKSSIKQSSSLKNANPLVNLTLLQTTAHEHQMTNKGDSLATDLLKGLVSSKETKVTINSFETPMKGTLIKGNNKISAPEINSTACKSSSSKVMEPSISSTLEKGSIIQKELSSKKIAQNLTESMMTEEKPKYPQDQIYRKMRLLRSKMTMSEAEKKLEELQRDPVANQGAIGVVTEGIKLTRAWRSRYQEMMLKQSRNTSKVRDLADDLEYVTVRVEEMESFLEDYIQHRIWKDKLTNAARILKKSKVSLSQTMDLEEDTTGQPRPPIEMLSPQELHEIINEAYKFTLDEQEESQVKELKNKAIQARNLEERIAENIEGVYEVNVLANFENDIKNLKIKLPQYETIQKRIMINREVFDLLNREVTIDQIERFFDKYPNKTDEVDTNNYYQLTRKYEQAKQLLQTARNLVITRTAFEFDDIQQTRETLDQADNLKISFDETKDLRNILRSFTWLMKMYSMIDEDTLKASNYEAMFSSKLDMSLPSFETETIINHCRALLEEKAEKAKRLSWLRLAVEEGENIIFADSRIEQLYSDCSLQLWRNESENFVGKKKNSRELERLLNDAPDVLMDKMDEETLRLLRDELAKIKEWRALYQSVIDPFIEDYIRTKIEKDLQDPLMKDKVFDLRWKLTKLSTEYSVDLSKYPDLEHNFSIVQKYLTWTTLAIRVAEISIQMDQGTKVVSFTELKELHASVIDHHIPKSVEFCKKIEDWYNQALETLKQFKNKFEKLKSKSEPMAVFDSIQKDSMKKTIERNKNRPTVVEALKIKYALEGANSFVSFADEINGLSDMLEKYQDWRMKLDAFMVSDERLTESAKDRFHVIEDYEQLGKDINYLKAEFVCLELHSEEDEKKLMSLDWQYRVYLLMKKLNTNPTASEWKKLIGYASDDPEIDLTTDKTFTKFLEEEMLAFKKASKLIKELIQKQRSEELRTLEDLERLYEQLLDSYIRLDEDGKALEELISKCKKLVARANYLSNTTEKEPIIEFTKTLDQIKYLPITLKAEEEMLERHLNDANKIVSLIRKSPSMDLAAAEKLIEEYKVCPVMITEAQKLQDNYENSRKSYQKIQSDLQKIVFKSESLTYEEICEMSQKVDEVNWDYDGQLTYTKMQVYVLKVGCLRKPKTALIDAESINNNTIALYTLRSLAAEGRELKKEIYDSRSLDESLFWIENILRQAEEKVNELKKINSIETLERVPSIFFNFLDLSQEIIEIKAALLAPKVAEVSTSQRTFSSMNRYNPEIEISSINGPKSKAERKNTKADPQAKNKREKEESSSVDPLDPLIKLLQKNKNLRLSEGEAKMTAEAIAKSFPEITNSQSRLKKFVTSLKKIVSLPNIAKHLLIKDFAKRELAPLLKETEDNLLLIEQRYANPDQSKRSGSHDLEPALAKKARTGFSTDQLQNYFTQLQSQEPEKKRRINNILRESGVLDRRMHNRNNGRQGPGNNRFKENYNRENRRPRAFNSQKTEENNEVVRQEFSDEELAKSNTLSNNLTLREQKELTSKKSKNATPYDPEDDEDALARELRTDNPIKNHQKIPGPESPTAEGAIFKIFKGTLKPINDKIHPKIAMYSRCPVDKIREIPEIIDERSNVLRIQGKLSVQKFEAYIKEFIGLSNNRDQFIISGWIEAESISHQQSCERISQDFVQDGSVGITRYLDCAKIFFIHKDQMPAEWAQKLDFTIQRVEQSVNPPCLAFILIYQPAKASFDASMLKHIAPEVQNPLQIQSQLADKALDDQRSHNTRQKERPNKGLSDLVTEDMPLLGGAYRKAPTFNFIKKYQQESVFPTSFKENQMAEANTFDDRDQSRAQTSKNLSFNIKNEFSRMDLEQPSAPNASRGFQYGQSDRAQVQNQKPFSQNYQKQNQAPQFSNRPYEQRGNSQGNRNSSSQRDLKMPDNLQKYIQAPQGADNGRANFPRQQHNTNRQMYPSNTNKSFQYQPSKNPSNNSFEYERRSSQAAGPYSNNFANQNRSKFSASQREDYNNHNRQESYNARNTYKRDTNNFANKGTFSQQQQQSYSKNQFDKNLLNIPLKNLDSSPGRDEFAPFQSSSMSNQMRNFDKYPSYKSNSQSMNRKW